MQQYKRIREAVRSTQDKLVPSSSSSSSIKPFT